MVKKAYIKSNLRLYKKHFIRLLSIAAIFLVTVSLDSGFGDVDNDIKTSIVTSYIEDNIHDFQIRFDASKNPNYTEFENKLNQNKDALGIDQIEKFYTFDYYQNEDEFTTRLMTRDFNNLNESVDKLEFKDPASKNISSIGEILVERATNDIKKHEINEQINLDFKIGPMPFSLSLKVVGVVKNPTMNIIRFDPSDYFNNEEVEHKSYEYIGDVYYFDENYMDSMFKNVLKLAGTSYNITLKNRNLFDSFSDDYKDKVDYIKEEISKYDSSVKVLTLYDNYSLYSLNMYAGKVAIIASIFIVFFALIAILVIYSTMSRLLDEERSSTAVLKTMGYSNFSIGIRFVMFTFVAGLVGIAISVIPARFVTQTILNAFLIQYELREFALPIVEPFFFLLSSSILIISLILILIKSVKFAKQNPVDLLTHKTLKVRKGISFKNSKLSFKMKSTWRNVFLYRARFVMTVLSIISSTVLIFASLSLLSCTLAKPDSGFDALYVISFILIIFSGALCALVTYNITNINISERTREIATLMVCGYRDKELTGYVFREIYILTLFGALLGIPAGYGFMHFVYIYMDIPKLLDYEFVEWWAYAIAPIATFLFAFVATLLLRRKILKINMNESLKVLE